MSADRTGIPDRHYELVTTVTGDRVKLQGLFQAGRSDRELSVDGAVVLHGLGGNFYSSTLNLRLADALTTLGIPTVLANTRGHDGVSTSPVDGRARTFGAAYEIVDECRHDVAGWVDWLASRQGCSRILLAGHSLGAIKALYAQAHQPAEHVAGIAGLSATRLNHENFLRGERASDFQKCFDLASQRVREDRGDELLHVDFPFPTLMCGRAYVDKYGPANRYDWLPFADRIDRPALLVFGERELSGNAAFQGLWQQATEATAGLPNYQLEIVASANHFYVGVHHRACAAVEQWLREKFAPAAG